MRKLLTLVLAAVMAICTVFPAAAQEPELCQWSEWIVEKAPACTEDGYRVRTCLSDAGYPHSQRETLPATGHDYRITTHEPDCVSPGVRTYTCRDCSDSYSETIPGGGGTHDYTETVIEPTCQAPGRRILDCAVCGAVHTEEIDMLEHDFSEQILKEPDCIGPGRKTLTCTACGDVFAEDYGQTQPHDYHHTESIQDGKKVNLHTCAVCGDTYTTEAESNMLQMALIGSAAFLVLDVASLSIATASILPDLRALNWLKKGKYFKNFL